MAVQDEYKVATVTTTANKNTAIGTAASKSAYDINYNDERFGKVESDKNQALTQLEQTYGGMIADTDKYYQDLKDSTQAWADKQSQLQQEQTDFAIEKIEQQKDQANKDYLKEQSGAYVDWRKQSNQYGTEAEKMASAGLANTGFSESSQVSMYNTYQNRVATARESYNLAVLNYNNAIKDAQLQNNAALAEIAFEALQKQLELSLEGFQYKNQLVLEQANKKIELDQMYYNRYQDVLQQINTENALAEDIRQFNENQRFQEEQAQLEREFKAQEAKLDRDFQAKQSEIARKFDAAQAELERKHDKEMLEAETKKQKEILAQQHKNDMAKLAKQQEYEMAQLSKQLANEKALLAYKNQLAQQQATQVTESGTTKSYNASKTPSKTTIQTNSNGRATLTSGFKGTTYEQAAAYLKSKGVPNNLMTASEWSRRRSSYSMTGQGSREVVYWDSYPEYIQAYVNQATKGK